MCDNRSLVGLHANATTTTLHANEATTGWVACQRSNNHSARHGLGCMPTSRQPLCWVACPRRDNKWVGLHANVATTWVGLHANVPTHANMPTHANGCRYDSDNHSAMPPTKADMSLKVGLIQLAFCNEIKGGMK